ncbi:MAG: phospholipase D-like domain-containing protein, partial [Bdellovibrionota bacterium]
ATLPLASQGPIPYARVIHSKFMTVDGQTLWLGTSNWSRGYFYETRGVELIFRSKELTNTADRLFSRLKDSAYLERVNDQTPVRPR